MQIDRQPSPWPCLAMLAGLLLFCLMAPRYWRHAVTAEDATIGVSVESEVNSSHRGLAGHHRRDVRAESSRQNGPVPLSGPTIEDLIATRVTLAQLADRANQWAGESIDWLSLMRAASNAELARSVDGPALSSPNPPNPELAAAMRFIGKKFGEQLSADGAETLRGVLHCGEKCESLLALLPAVEVASPVEQRPRSTVRVIGPNDRLAMLPAPRELDGALRPWCVPQVLFNQLDRLADQADAAQWASHVRNQLHALTDREQLQGDDVQTILGDLTESAQEALHMADQTNSDRLRVELLRAHWALARRLDCWGAMHEKHVAMHFQGRVAARGSLTPYLAGTPAQPPASSDVTALSNDLETYESNRDPKIGRSVAQQQQTLKSSANSADRALGDAMEQNYRNANIRVAITAEMLNRLVETVHTESNPVLDRIAGTVVRGQSNVRTESRVLLDPSDDDWQLEVSAHGQVQSNTMAGGGPVRFRSRGTTDFSAHKSVVVDDNGIQLKHSDVNATSRNQLVGVTTDYDWVPLFGSYARNRAIEEYRARQGRVRAEIESRVERQAREQVDQQTREAVDNVRQQTYERFASGLDEFGIKLTPVEMKTTPERLVARIRVAGEKQLGSHTPRPRALSDSIASAQIHETALTNLAVTLGLDGKRYTAPELQKTLREKFSQLASKNPPEIRRDTIFHFAPQDALQFHINQGRLELTVAFASVEFDQDEMQNVVVHAYYMPKVDGLNAELVRDGTLGIEGRFTSAERAQLHNVFNRVLPPERHLPIVRLQNPADKRFEGLMITQLVLEDGWAGLSVGPASDNRTAERSRSFAK